MEQSCWKIPFSILQFTKEAEYAISWSKIRFFRNVARFARKLLSIRILFLTHSKLVGTPCISTQVLRKSLICFFLCLSFSRCNHDGFRTKLGARLVGVEKLPFKGLLRKMGSKLSCSCGPLKIKGYRFVFWILRLFVFFFTKKLWFYKFMVAVKKSFGLMYKLAYVVIY